MTGMTSHRDRLVRLVAEAREPLGLRRQVDFVKASGLSKSTVGRFEQGQPVDAETLRTISRTVKWTAESAQEVLAGGDPVPVSTLEGEAQQWRREPVAPDALSQLIRNIVFEAIIGTAPDTPASKIREIEERAHELAREAGYGLPRAKQDSHTEEDPNV